jgi:hypothetical protein
VARAGGFYVGKPLIVMVGLVFVAGRICALNAITSSQLERTRNYLTPFQTYKSFAGVAMQRKPELK